jgi:hypothetical protein
MIKTLFILIIGFLIVLQFANPSTLKKVDLTQGLTLVESGLNNLLTLCEKIDYYVFEPVKIKYIPGYVPKNPPGEDGETANDQSSQQPQENSAPEPQIVEQYVKITLNTGFVAEGKLISQNEGRYTIEMDGYPVVFTESEIASVKYLTE